MYPLLKWLYAHPPYFLHKIIEARFISYAIHIANIIILNKSRKTRFMEYAARTGKQQIHLYY
jgi:hypothetical protein